MRSLGWHINSIHSVNETEYKQQFGIPYGVGIVCAETHIKHVASSERAATSEELAERAARARALFGKQRNGGTAKWRETVLSVRNQRTERIGSVNSLKPPKKPKAKIPMTPGARARIRAWSEANPERSQDYMKAKNWWTWQRNPEPLIAYAAKWGAKLRIMPKLLEAAGK